MKFKSTKYLYQAPVLLVLILISGLAVAQQLPDDFEAREKARDAFGEYLKAHEFSNRPRKTKEEWKKVDKRDRPDLAWEQDFLRTMDPVTKRPESQRMYNYMIQRSQAVPAGIAPGATGNNWVERGPNNIGGRTRAIAWDPRVANKVWAGGVTGGLWYNTNIHNSSNSWTKVNDFWDNIAVTAIAFDPNNNNTLYVGTGEGWGTGSGIGGGIWKSTNGGSSFSLLSSTVASGTEMRYVNDLLVRNESGTSVIYAAVSRMSYKGRFHGDQGLFRSSNGGTSWTQVLPNVASGSGVYAPADLELDAGNRLWVGTRRNSFLDGGGTILYSDNGTSWTTSYNFASGRRVELACAPSNQNTVYAIISSFTGGTNVVDRIIASSNRGSSWGTRQEPADADNGIPNTDFSRGQAWYDLILRVDPNDRNTLYAGAINLFRSTNGGFSWTQFSKWSNNSAMNTLNIPLVHADQHAIEFKPNSSDTVLFGTDGGVYYSANASTATLSNLSVTKRNTGYNVTQFYAGALHPTSGNNHMIAGSQDNGTIRINSAGVSSGTEVRGGDGAFCFIDQNQPQYQIASYVYNTYYLSTNGGTSTFTTQLIRDLNTGSFINPADYDDNRNVLFSARSSTSITRVKNVTGSFTDDNFTVTGMNAMASALKVSPHTTSSSTLYVGSANGRLYKITGADGASPSTTRIDNSAFPTGSISCVQVGGSEDTLLVTMFNYGVNSVWYTTNGGTNWTNKDNTSLPDMPIRWALFNPFVKGEVILATELGIWSTSDINASSPTWSGSNNGLANVRVDMLQQRNSDSTVMAITYGRGVFTSKWAVSVTTKPNASFTANDTTICAGDTVSFTNTTSGSVTSRAWTFTGGSPSTTTIMNPQVVYSSPGNYTVRLISTNAIGSDTVTKTNHITVSASPTVSLTAFSSVTTATAPFALSGGSPSGGTYSGPGVSGGNFNPASAGVGTHTITYSFTNGNGCTRTASRTITVSSATTVNISLPSTACENAGNVTLSGTPSGGTFSGTGVSGNTFNPVTAGPGNHNITYTVTGTGSDTKTINVIRVSAGLGSFAPMCDNQPSLTLSGGSPTPVGAAIGVYKINGTIASVFDPAVQGPGTDTIHYVYTDANGCSDSVFQTITVSGSPNVTLASIANQCEGNNSFALTGGSPGPGNYYVNGSVSSNFNPASLGAGTHTVKYDYVNNNFCRDSASVSVVVNPQPTVNFAALADVCANDASFALTGGTPTGGSYSGSGISGGFFDPASVTSNSSYTLSYKYTDANSCTDSTTQNIFVKPIPIIRASNDTAICFGASIQLSAGGGVNYTWTPSAGLSSTSISNPVATPFINTKYFVTGTTFNGCSNFDSVDVVVNSIPSVNAGNDITICDGAIFQLNGVGAANYSWSPNTGLNSTNISNPTGRLSSNQNYILTGTSAAGCTATDTVAVQVDPKPVVNAGIDTSICETETYMLMATGASIYAWSPAAGLSSSSVANPSYVVNGTSTYSVIGTNSFGCSDTDEVVIIGKPLPTVIMNPIPAMCIDDQALNLSQGSPSGGSYTGIGVLAGSQFRPTLAGVGSHTITYTFTGLNSCVNTAQGNVVVYAQPQVGISGLNNLYCENDPTVGLSLTPSSGGNLTGPGIVGSSFNPSNAGLGQSTIQYNFTDSNGCSNSYSQMVKVSEVFPVSSIQGFKRVLKSRQYTYSVEPVNGAAYQWTVINGTLVAQANNVATVAWGTVKDGRIIVRQTSLDGCSDSTEAFISVGTVGAEEFSVEEILRVYPNPARNKMTIETQGIDGQVSIFAMDGKLVYSNIFNTSNQSVELDISLWPRGVYSLRWNSEAKMASKRIVID